MVTYIIVAFFIGIILGFVGRILYAKKTLNSFESKSKILEKESKKILEDSRKKAEQTRKEILLEAKDDIYKEKREFEKEMKERRNELQQYEKVLVYREDDIVKKQEFFNNKEKEFAEKENLLKEKKEELNEEVENISILKGKIKKELESLANMTAEEAKEILIKTIEEEARQDASIKIKKIEEELKNNSSKKAKEIIVFAIQRLAVEYTNDITVSSVVIPNDEMKGRIIGREGRNIKAFEMATGVDVIVDDTPETINLTSFDMVRREIAKISLERLIADGRIHPARIEDVVTKVTSEMKNQIREIGERALITVGISGVSSELIDCIGRLKYRTSYGQNVLQHSLEVAFLSKFIASELGLDEKLCLMAGFFHDIGKAVDHDVEGTHAEIGYNMLKKYYPKNEKMLNAVLTHHECEFEAESLEAIIVATADAISASRPGARRESLEFYIKRVQKLEEIANSFKGVEKAFAIQAGREIRIMIEPDKVKEEEMVLLSKDIAKKIEENLDYPGQIKVTLIRETRVNEIAR